MANKKTNLDVSLYELGGVSFLEVVENCSFDTEVMTDLCRAVNERYGAEKAVKKEFKFSADILQHVADECASGLTLSVFSFDGTSYLGEIESFDLDVSTDTQNGDGPTEVFRWPQAVGTDYNVSANKFIVSNVDWMQAAIANNVTGVEVQIAFTVAGIAISLPMTLSSAKHNIQGDSLQMEEVSFKKRGTPDTVTGDSLLIEILTGDAYLTWAADSDAGSYGGNALITSAKLSVKNGALVKSSYEFSNQGAPSFVAA